MNDLENSVLTNSLNYVNSLDVFLKNFQGIDILRSYLLHKFKKTQAKLSLPTNVKLSKRCPKCLISRTPNLTQFRIDSLKNKRIRIKKETVGHANNRNNYSDRKSISNRLVIKCRICEREVKENLQGFKKNAAPVNTSSETQVNVRTKKGKKGAEKNKQAQVSKRKMKPNNKKRCGLLSAALNNTHKSGRASLKDFLQSIS